MAAANGYPDGENLPLSVALDNLRRIVAAIQAGAIGCNLEDSFPADGSLRAASDQAVRLAAARKAADAAGVAMFINARTDVFFQKPAPEHDAAMANAALERARAYADAGASGLFVPGLPSRARLAELGVARISHGPGPYAGAMQWLTGAAKAAMA